MHPAMKALVDLAMVDARRLQLRRGRTEREAKLAAAQALAAKAGDDATKAEADAHNHDALIRQYTADVARCDKTIAEMRGKQTDAKTNKEYLQIFNAVEAARAEKTLREESLKQLGGKIDGLKAAAAAVRAKADEAARQAAALAVETEAATAERDEEAKLDALYAEKKAAVDPKFLESYERLVKANHPMPLTPVDPKTRSTPLGRKISLNQLDQIARGMLALDEQTKAILYIKD